MHNSRMDPSSAVTKLIGSGMTEQGIASAVKVSQSTVNRIRRRKVAPSYDVGRALVEMAAGLDAPRKRRQGRAH